MEAGENGLFGSFLGGGTSNPHPPFLVADAGESDGAGGRHCDVNLSVDNFWNYQSEGNPETRKPP